MSAFPLRLPTPVDNCAPTLPPPVARAELQVLDGVQTMVAELSATKGEDVLAAYPQLAAYKARFEALPAVAAYRGSAEYMTRPFNNKIGVWM